MERRVSSGHVRVMDDDVVLRGFATEPELTRRRGRLARLHQHERDRRMRVRKQSLADGELGPKIEGLRIVRSGLNKDDTIIVKGLQRVRPGSPVTPEVIPMASQETLAALAQQRQALEASNLPQVAPAKVAPGTVVKVAAATPRG